MARHSSTSPASSFGGKNSTEKTGLSWRSRSGTFTRAWSRPACKALPRPRLLGLPDMAAAVAQLARDVERRSPPVAAAESSAITNRPAVRRDEDFPRADIHFATHLAVHPARAA